MRCDMTITDGALFRDSENCLVRKQSENITVNVCVDVGL